VICGKHREGDRRVVAIMDGDPSGHNVVIIDDLVQTGGTLIECGKVLKARGAASVSAFVVHSVFPKVRSKDRAGGGEGGVGGGQAAGRQCAVCVCLLT
jgi:phosphoribosylpyrophosphate synthetase